jgi:hypothetical protein
MADQVNTELFKVASTLFLGIGVAAVLQTDLLPLELKEASARARGRFSSVDTFFSALMIILIAAGEFICIRVLTAEKGLRQMDLAHHTRSDLPANLGGRPCACRHRVRSRPGFRPQRDCPSARGASSRRRRRLLGRL